ncbi:hypothetical protein LTR78_001990 [Recurvomyces mirabilis]|uniref:Queuosine 5'-phosphate N-glycosylase/hydrolase n=1 Tax=Recurvomyces mirabilis TaxID=574656 RepID=A0AAE0WU84_9PEZI|nr:hypothetical protein LTR78_001990 [Recurvomyces mirabilis]KAK5160448.1 hypothetical protein LTS14_001460 [Recurvomyces mirabilis]
MSDDEADPELLALLRQSLGIGVTRSDEVSEDTGVLKDAEYIYKNSIDVIPDMLGTKSAALQIHKLMQERSYSTAVWSEHDFHPSAAQGFSDVDMVNFIFTMDLLNFSFWSEKDESERFQVEYQGQRCTGYKSLVAALRRALEDGVPITTPAFWRSEEMTEQVFEGVFRSATNERMPMLQQRIAVLKEAAELLHESFRDPDEAAHADQTMEDTRSTIERGVAHTTGEENATQAEPDLTSPEAALESVATGVPVEMGNNVSERTEPSPLGNSTAAINATANGLVIEAEEHETTAPTKLESEVKAIPAADTPKHHPLPPDHSVLWLIQKADHSAGKLVNLLAKHFPCFRDEARFDGRRIRFLKRAQIFVADLWAAFQGTGYGEFRDIGHLTMFAGTLDHCSEQKKIPCCDFAREGYET